MGGHTSAHHLPARAYLRVVSNAARDIAPLKLHMGKFMELSNKYSLWAAPAKELGWLEWSLWGKHNKKWMDMTWREHLKLRVRVTLGPLYHLFCPEPAGSLHFLNFWHFGAVGHLARQWELRPRVQVRTAQRLPRHQGFDEKLLCVVWDKSKGEERGSISSGKKQLGALCLRDNLYPSLSKEKFFMQTGFYHSLLEEDNLQMLINTFLKLNWKTN